MRCNFGLLGNINVLVKFADVMDEWRLTPHNDYHLSSIYILGLGYNAMLVAPNLYMYIFKQLQ